ncbi:uncharacterized protein [Littorina saxatilis]|uniref:uncharacterized protein n=1 Tax=Littorina saxatilis TaxID=31220 RepID=UPI0038B41A06
MSRLSLPGALKPAFVFLSLSGLYITPLKQCNCSSVLSFGVTFLISLSGVCLEAYETKLEALSLLNLKPNLKNISLDLSTALYSFSLLFLSVGQAISITRHFPKFVESAKTYFTRYDRSVNKMAVLVVSTLVSILAFVLSCLVGWFYSSMKFSGSSCSNLEEHTEDSVRTLCCVEKWRHFLTMHRSLLYLWAPPILYSFLWFVLLIEMKRFHFDLAKHFVKASGDKDYEYFRMRHAAICNLMDDANAVVGHFLFATYGVGIPVLLIALRSLIYGELSSTFTYVVMYIMVHYCATLVMVTLSGAVLAKQALRPAQILYEISIDSVSDREFRSLSMFLSRLQGGSIGFHVYGLFNIDNSTILMVLGTVVTYAVVILQF